MKASLKRFLPRGFVLGLMGLSLVVIGASSVMADDYFVKNSAKMTSWDMAII